ncbi:putative phosphatase regulatory subunit, partial [Ostertagia ostertagi]
MVFLQYDPPSPCYSNPTDSEPPSPDSGFSSDENVSPLSRRYYDLRFPDVRRQLTVKTLRRSRSKACAKRVRFADALGLDLEKRQYFTEKDPDLFPTPPSSPTPGHRLVLSNFVYCSESEYNQRARDQMVCLAKLRVHGHTINGQVNVANIAFSKEVAIRYTTSNWATHDEVAATYGHTVFGADNVDAFVFSMMLPAGVK